MNLQNSLPVDDGGHEQQEDSVLGLMRNLQTDRDEAAQGLWDRYYPELVKVAKRMLQGVPKGMADEEDVAQSVFRSICRGGEEGRFNDLRNRDELWWLLLALTRQKAANYVRNETRQKRGHGKVHCEADLQGNPLAEFSLANLIGTAPTPELLTQMREEHQQLMQLLERSGLQQVAELRIAGYDITEIAEQLKVSNRSVLRKLAIVRKVWEGRLAMAIEAENASQ